ncbi:MAG: hypothetical protein AABY07_08425 [Nanoarchaeota archaeon]
MSTIVTNAAPLIHLYQIGEIDILPKLYDEIWTSKYVFNKEIIYPEELLIFRDLSVKEREPSKENLEGLLTQFKGKINYGEITCAALYLDGDYDGILMAENKSENYFINIGMNVRNFLELSYVAILKELFDEERAKAYLRKAVKKFKPPKRVREKFTEEGFGFLLEGL